MELKKHIVSLIFVLLTVFTFGLCSAQEVTFSDTDLKSMMGAESKSRDKRATYSTFDPEIDWSRHETETDADNTLVNFLKRDIFPMENGSGRFPRINRRKIIPFYQYGNDFRAYRTNPRFSSPRRYSYFVSPWKMGGYNIRRRVLRVPTYQNSLYN